MTECAPGAGLGPGLALTAALAGWEMETELVLVLDTEFGLGEELVLTADVEQRVAAEFPLGVPLGVDTKFW